MAGRNGAGRDSFKDEDILEEVTALQAGRAARDSRGVFHVEGVRNFVQVADTGHEIRSIIFSERLLTSPLARKLVRRMRRSGVRTLGVTPEQFRQISRTRRASGIAAILSQRWTSLRDVSPDTELCWVVLEKVRSPGNLGTLIRSSEAVGGAGFIFVGGWADPYDPNVIRSAMGAMFRQSFVRTSYCDLRRWIDQHRCNIVGASPDGTADLHQLRSPETTLLVLVEERKGLTPQQRALCRQLVRIPMVGSADSLNLAVSGTLLMYELYRWSAQR